MKKLSFIACIGIAFLIFSIGCGNQSDSFSEQGASDKSSVALFDSSADLGNEESEANTTPTEKSAKSVTKKVIRNANLFLLVDMPEETIKRIEQKVKDLQGWILESNYSKNQTSFSASIQLRIPEKELDSFLEWIEEIGTVNHRQIYTNEITKEYFDIEARLENAKKQKDQYQSIMRKANTIKEILEVQQQIDQVQERMDTYTRQIEIWDLEVANSKVEIQLSPNPRTIETHQDSKWEPLSWSEMTKSFKNHFIRFFNGFTLFLQKFLVFFFSVLLWLLLILWGLWIVIRKIACKIQKSSQGKSKSK